MRGAKKAKDRITVALAANVMGSERLKPLVIYKFKNPRCYGKTFDPNALINHPVPPPPPPPPPYGQGSGFDIASYIKLYCGMLSNPPYLRGRGLTIGFDVLIALFLKQSN